VNKPAISSDSQQTSLLGSMSHAWRALRHRNFKLFFFGQSISLIGTWMTRLATTWLVYRLTHSALLLGIVTFAGQIVSFAVGPVAGVWVERLNRRKLLVWTQAAAAVQSLAHGRAHAGACHQPPGNRRSCHLAGPDQRI
jgi:MFS family permease